MNIWQSVFTSIGFFGACMLMIFIYSQGIRYKMVMGQHPEDEVRRAVWKFRVCSILVLAIMALIRLMMGIGLIIPAVAYALVGFVGVSAAAMWGVFQRRMNR